MILTAYRDDVTGLRNRKKLLEDIKLIPPGTSACFVVLNIRDFHEVNELLGFEKGNLILKEVGKELKKFIRRNARGKCCVYRVRGDKFGILCKELGERQFVELVEKAISNLENKEFSVQGITLRLDIVGGISTNLENPIIESEIAEIEAKKLGENVVVFDDKLKEKLKQAESNIRIAMEIKKALETDGVIPFYQPIVDLKTLTPVKYEALMRLKVKDKYLYPKEFFPVAKRTSLYRKLSMKVMERAFKLASEKNVSVSVNISTEDIANERMVEWILSTIERYKVSHRVCFEIVETEAFGDIKLLENFYFKIRGLGIQVAIDDFGSGYSNYEYLAAIRPDYIKIDGSLISKITQSEEIEKLVYHIVSLAKDFGIETVAEFVSNEELYQKVKELGIDYGQGYFFGKPSPEV